MSLDNGLRHDHTVTCTLAGTPTGCACPFSFWKPRESPRRRVKVVGTEAEALRLRDHMQREASGTVYFSAFTPHAFAPVPAPAAGLPIGLPAMPAPTQHTPTFGEWAQQVMETVWIRHSPRTRQTRTSVYRLYVEPDLAAVDLADVNAAFVSAWIAELVRREVSPHMQRHAYDLVRTITGVWYEQAGLPNPVAAVKRPKSFDYPYLGKVRAKYRIAVMLDTVGPNNVTVASRGPRNLRNPHSNRIQINLGSRKLKCGETYFTRITVVPSSDDTSRWGLPTVATLKSDDYSPNTACRD